MAYQTSIQITTSIKQAAYNIHTVLGSRAGSSLFATVGQFESAEEHRFGFSSKTVMLLLTIWVLLLRPVPLFDFLLYPVPVPASGVGIVQVGTELFDGGCF